MAEFLKVWVDDLEQYRKLSDAEYGRLIRAALHYKRTGEELQLSGREELMWDGKKLEIDRDKERQNGVSHSRAEAGRKGATARWQSDGKNSKNGKCHLPYGKNGLDNGKDKGKGKGKDKDKGQDGTDAAVARVVQCYESNFGMIPRAAGDDIAWYLAEGYEPELLCAVIDDAARHGARGWAYVLRVLQGCAQRGVRTASAWAGEQRADHRAVDANPFLAMAGGGEL